MLSIVFASLPAKNATSLEGNKKKKGLIGWNQRERHEPQRFNKDMPVPFMASRRAAAQCVFEHTLSEK